jgi:hypothetical protein
VGFWRRSKGIEPQLRAANAEPNGETSDSINTQIGASRRRGGSRISVAVVLAVALAGGVFALGGVGYATSAVQNAVSPSSILQTSSSCNVDVPCTFTLTATPPALAVHGTGDVTGRMKVQELGSAPQPITLTYTVVSSCTSAPANFVTVTFDDNPIPKGAIDTSFHVRTNHTSPGIYTITITGTSGTQQSPASMELKVRGPRKC